METTMKATSKNIVMLPLEKISSDPNQPRRTFEEISSLAESIKTNGVLHAIRVRPIQDGYMIIYGERRYRAALMLQLSEIEAIIERADITEEEIKVLQLIENIQREDVHPMQNAKSFKFLIDERKMTVDNIVQFIGKSVYYVRQQLKLNDLSDQWQTLFLKNGISHIAALLICTLSEDAQKALYSDRVDKNEAKKSNPTIEISQSLINRYKGSLAEASFDMADSSLDEKAGACIGCPFNSASTSLFPEDEKRPHCNRMACFTNKTDLHLKREISNVLADPTTIFVYDSYQAPELIKKMKNDGVEVLKIGYGDDCKKVQPPTKPDWNQFKGDKNRVKRMTVSELKKLFTKEESVYEKEFKAFENNIALGKYKKALVLHGYNHKETGRYIFVELTPKAPAKVTKKAIENGNPTGEDIDSRIKEIQKDEIRAKERDQEKVHRKIVEQIKEDKTLQVVPVKACKIDDLIIKFLLFELLGYHKQKELGKLFRKPGLENTSSFEKFFPALQSISKEQITYILRQIIIGKYSVNLPNSAGGHVIRLMAESLGSIPIAEYEQGQQEIAKNRQLRKKKEIAVLKEMKAGVEKNTKSKAKVSASSIKNSSKNRSSRKMMAS